MNQDDVYAAIADAVVDVCDVDPETLDRDTPVITLDLDSMSAAEIVTHVQSVIGRPIDFRALSRDWSTFTLDTLAVELMRCVEPKWS